MIHMWWKVTFSWEKTLAYKCCKFADIQKNILELLEFVALQILKYLEKNSLDKSLTLDGIIQIGLRMADKLDNSAIEESPRKPPRQFKKCKSATFSLDGMNYMIGKTPLGKSAVTYVGPIDIL